MESNINFMDIYVKPQLPEGLKQLEELAQNIWSTWDTDAYRLYSRIDPHLFRKFQHNPIKLLQTIPENRLQELTHQKGFLHELDIVYQKFQQYLNYKGSYQMEDGSYKEFDFNKKIAYFSMEYGLHESLPIYSGGLGILAGDHLKAASDLGLPLVGLGLLYRYGYFSQKIDMNGNQKEHYEENEWYSKPVRKVTDENGNDLILRINIQNKPINIKVWQIDVGKIPLYLLDTNLEQNEPEFKKITDYLYVSDKQTRLLQEIVLAFGSMELIQKLKLNPVIYHMNDGHSAFLIIKRLLDLQQKHNFSFDKAANFVRSSSVFTTHTPVPAGNEKFNPDMVKEFLNDQIEKIGLQFNEFAKYAQVNDESEISLSALAIRFSNHINGVSQLHSKVSRNMWHDIYPKIYEKEMPITAITNGVHSQSWLSRTVTRLFDRYLGTDYKHRGDQANIWKNINAIPSIEIWEAHQQRKEQMISFIRNRLKESLLHKGSGINSSEIINNTLNPAYLTVGFARRFATYKRANLILKDKAHLLKLLLNSERPIQFVFAGKAHPADAKGKEMIKNIIDFARANNVQDRFVFIENYDMNIGRHLVQGVDIWLNNPIKPLEASGTSGIKAGMNGALNLSILDGWWPECYNKENGWAIDAGENIEDETVRDTLEANQIYELLENEILPLYYDRDQNNIPYAWIEKMRNSMYDVCRNFNIHRMLKNYIQKFYLPSIEHTEKIQANNFALLQEYEKNEKLIDSNWQNVKIMKFDIDLQVKTIIDSGKKVEAKAIVNCAKLPADFIEAELFYKMGTDEFKLIPLKLAENNEQAIFSGSFQLEGAGKQSFNFRIRPKKCCCQKFYKYIKWYY
ncbi:MAG: alpha-glucan family phosphorylase [Candidatus Cloacimonadota bacterium]|nr:alpha-glucan family phosphorylase [Candidatus Cloacimonadota bacterium]